MLQTEGARRDNGETQKTATGRPSLAIGRTAEQVLVSGLIKTTGVSPSCSVVNIRTVSEVLPGFSGSECLSYVLELAAFRLVLAHWPPGVSVGVKGC